MVRTDNFGRRLLVSVDIKDYGSRDDRQRIAAQDGLLAILDEAAANARLARADWHRHQEGDGELAILPESEPEPRVLDDFVRELRTELERHNHDLFPQARLRLRMAIHHGVVIPSSNGYTGGGVTEVSRMLNSERLRAALAASGAYLAVLISHRLYEEIILQRHTSLKRDDFRRVIVRNKEYDKAAWLHVPGVDVHSLDLPDDPSGSRSEERTGASPGGDEDPSGTTVSTRFYGSVSAPNSVFGIAQR